MPTQIKREDIPRLTIKAIAESVDGCSKNENEILLTDNLAEDLNADSLDIAVIYLELQNTFDIDITDDELIEDVMVQDLVTLIEQKLFP